MYVSAELSREVLVYDFHRETGAMEFRQRISPCPRTFRETILRQISTALPMGGTCISPIAGMIPLRYSRFKRMVLCDAGEIVPAVEKGPEALPF